MQNLGAVCDQIKAVAQACDGTPTAKFIAVLIAAGVTDTKDIAAILGIGERAVQKVRRANYSSPNTGTPNQSSRTTVRSEPQDANHSSGPNHSSPESEPQFGSEPRAPARIETPSGLLPCEDIGLESPPSPSNVQPVTDWRSAFGADDNHGVQFSNGRLTLVNGTRAFWLEQFGGDETALNLALIEAAGSIQRGSNAGLKLQVERKLANIARDTRDRDKRYERVAGKNRPQSGAPPVSPMRALLNKSKGQEVRV